MGEHSALRKLLIDEETRILVDEEMEFFSRGNARTQRKTEKLWFQEGVTPPRRAVIASTPLHNVSIGTSNFLPIYSRDRYSQSVTQSPLHTYN